MSQTHVGNENGFYNPLTWQEPWRMMSGRHWNSSLKKCYLDKDTASEYTNNAPKPRPYIEDVRSHEDGVSGSWPQEIHFRPIPPTSKPIGWVSSKLAGVCDAQHNKFCPMSKIGPWDSQSSICMVPDGALSTDLLKLPTALRLLDRKYSEPRISRRM